MANNRRKSAAIALALVGVAGLGIASAATLNVTSNSLQAGSVQVQGCEGATGVNVSWTYGWQAGGYVATGGSVNNIDATCAAGTVGVTALAGSTATAATVSGAVPAAGGSVSFSLATPVAVTALSDVAVVITK